MICPDQKNRKLYKNAILEWKRKLGLGNQIIGEDDDAIQLPNPIIGFGTRTYLCQILMSLQEAAT